MTLIDIMKQAQALSPKERKELVKMLVDSLDVEPSAPVEPTEHWGQNLLRLLDEIGPIDLIYPEIEDPVEWVKQIRRDQQQKRLGSLDQDE
jgi:hypothetical protein